MDSGTLLIFDQRPDAPDIDKRTTLTTTSRAITLLTG
jgi:hypothetical protein